MTARKVKLCTAVAFSPHTGNANRSSLRRMVSGHVDPVVIRHLLHLFARFPIAIDALTQRSEAHCIACALAPHDRRCPSHLSSGLATRCQLLQSQAGADMMLHLFTYGTRPLAHLGPARTKWLGNGIAIANHTEARQQCSAMTFVTLKNM
jgi:hypothetical protein